jgi:hypothetical protein
MAGASRYALDALATPGHPHKRHNAGGQASPGAGSFQSGLTFSINAVFHARFQRFRLDQSEPAQPPDDGRGFIFT